MAHYSDDYNDTEVKSSPFYIFLNMSVPFRYKTHLLKMDSMTIRTFPPLSLIFNCFLCLPLLISTISRIPEDAINDKMRCNFFLRKIKM